MRRKEGSNRDSANKQYAAGTNTRNTHIKPYMLNLELRFDKIQNIFGVCGIPEV